MSQLTQQIHSSEIGDILENSLNGIRPKKEDYLRLVGGLIKIHEIKFDRLLKIDIFEGKRQ